MIDRWRMLEERNRREDASSFIVTNDNLILVKSDVLYSHGFSVIINITGHYLCGEHEKEISLEFLDN